MQENDIKIVILGTPNVGKSLIFNALTKSNQAIGNWCGTTTQICSATINYKGHHMEFTDVPGVYGLGSFSSEEMILQHHLHTWKPDVAVVIIESLNFERGLYLLLQIKDRFSKVLVVCNKTLLAKQHGIQIEYKRLAEELDLPVVVFDEEKPNCIFDKLLSIVKEDDRKGTRSASQSETLTDELLQLKTISQRYHLAGEIAKKCIKKTPGKAVLSDKIDKWALHPYLGIPIMLLVFGLLFLATFTFSRPFSEMISNIFDLFGDRVDIVLPLWGMPEFLTSLVTDGLIKGIGATLVFLPQMVVFFMAYSLIQDSGYIVRVAFLMDRIMRTMGLNGKMFLPIIVGYSCNVNGIIATRVLSSRYERLVAILVNSFVPCSARMGVIVFLVSAFFSSLQATLVLLSLMLIGTFLMAIVAYFVKLIVHDDEDMIFMMELPYYQIPSLLELLTATLSKTIRFLARIKNVIIYSSIIMWFLASYPQGPFSGTYIAQIGQALEPYGKWLGFNWQLIVALLLGIAAKETTLTALGIMYHAAEDQGNLVQLLTTHIDPVVAFTFILVYTIYTPCVTTVLTIYQETKDWKITVVSVLINMGLALLLGSLVYHIGLVLF